MPTHFRAIIWIDHLEARIFHFGLSGEDEIVLHPHLPTRHLHHKANTIGSGHAEPDLAKYLRHQDSKTGDRIVAVEAADHPSDGEIVAHARQYFGMRPPRAGTTHGSITAA